MSASGRISAIFSETHSRYLALITSLLGFGIATWYVFQRFFVLEQGPYVVAVIEPGTILEVAAVMLYINAIFLLIGVALNKRTIIGASSVFSLAGGWLGAWLTTTSLEFISLTLKDTSNYVLLQITNPFLVFSPGALLTIAIIITSVLTLYGYGHIQLEHSNPFDGLALISSIIGISGIILANIIGNLNLDEHMPSIYPEFYLILLIGPIILLFGTLVRQKLIIGSGSILSLLTIALGIFIFTKVWYHTTRDLNPYVMAISGLGYIFAVLSLLRVILWRRWREAKQPVLRVSSKPMHKAKTPIPEHEVSPSTSHISPTTQLTPTSDSDVIITSGYDVAGESLKLGVKISNTGKLAILNVTVILDIPDGFEFDRETLPSQKLGNIAGGSYQSAIFWLKPLRCVDDEYGGSIFFRDASNATHTLEVPRKRIVNICPMLSSTERSDDVFKKLKFGSLKRNCASFKFNGNPKTAFALAEARLKGLNAFDRSEDSYSDGTYLGYSCYVGETKFGEEQFAAEIQASGKDLVGVLTLGVYSDDERILSGFFADIMPGVRDQIEILEEQVCPIATCPKCGADIDTTSIEGNRVYKCAYCGAVSKVASWLT